MFELLNDLTNSKREGLFDYSTTEWVDIGLSIAFIIGVLVVVLIFFRKKKSIVVFYSVSLAMLILAILFKLYFLAICIAMVVLIMGVSTMFFNLGPLHEAFTLSISTGKDGRKGKGSSAGEAFDEKKFFDDVETSVLKLSSTKTGAIMTFERNMDLDPYMKNGTIIDAPFTPELVETIFYVGTRLHDGAIIVRGNTIVAASVYYTPSTKALTGKFGARHRAGLGISEATDSVTVICSEETGRISIAYNGRLESVRRDEFKSVFKEYMSK